MAPSTAVIAWGRWTVIESGVGRTSIVFLGIAVAVWLLSSAVRTLVIPRPERVWLTGALFRAARWVTVAIARRFEDPARRHWLLGGFAPVVLISLPLIWSVGLIVAFAGIFAGFGELSFVDSLELSGSSLTTLGFIDAPTVLMRGIAIIEALLGLAIVALVISFLPTFYAMFSRRELAVGRLTTRAGEPPTPFEFIVRLNAIKRLDGVGERWEEWESWFTDVGETHTNFPALVYFRSARVERSWVTAAETALDSAALVTSLQLVPSTGQAQTLIRSGYLSLRGIADYFNMQPEIDPRLLDEQNVTRLQFDRLVDALVAQGVEVNVPRDEAWTAFAGWRINYDRAIVGLQELVVDVPSHWTSHRSMREIQP
jgi:hypothetical protein